MASLASRQSLAYQTEAASPSIIGQWRTRTRNQYRSNIAHCCLTEYKHRSRINIPETQTQYRLIRTFACIPFRHFGESGFFGFHQSTSKFAHGEWRSLIANPDTRPCDLGSKTAKQLYNSYQICSDHFEDSQYMDPAHTSLMPHAISIDFI